MINLEEYKNWLQLNTDSKNTVEDYIYIIKKFLKFTNGEIKQKNLDEYLYVLLNKSKNTFNKEMYAISKYCTYLKLNLDFPKTKKINQKTQIKISFDQLEKDIFPYLTLIFKDWFKRELMIRLMYYTGLRASEVAKLKVEDIDFQDKVIHVKNTKGKKDRFIPFFDKKLYDDLILYVKNKNGLVFNMKYTEIYRTFSEIKKQVKLNVNFHPHLLRVGFANFLWDKKLRIETIKELLGHKDIQTTLIYLSITDDMILKDCEKIRI